MSEKHQLGEVILNKQDVKGQNLEKQLATSVQALWEDTHKEKSRDKKVQDQEFSAKLEKLDRKLHQEGGVLSGKNAKDLHLVGLGHNNGEAKLLFSDKKKGETQGEHLYLVDDSGKIVASSELKERKATTWKTQEAPKADSSQTENAHPDRSAPRQDRYDAHQGQSSKDCEANNSKPGQSGDSTKDPTQNDAGRVEIQLNDKVKMEFGDKSTEPERVNIKRSDKSGDLVLKRIGENDYVAQGSDSDKHYTVKYDKQSGDFTYSRVIKDVYDPTAPGERDVTIRADGSQIRTIIADKSAVSDNGQQRRSLRFLEVQSIDPSGKIQADIRYSAMEGSPPSEAVIRMSDGHYVSLTASSIWQNSMQDENGNWYKVSFDNKTGVSKLVGETQVTEVYPNGVATLTPMDGNHELQDHYKQIRIGSRVWTKQRGLEGYQSRNGERAHIEIDQRGNSTITPIEKSK